MIVINIKQSYQLNKTFYILFFVFASVFCNAQTNLVYNGDFELYDTCPANFSSPWDHQIATCYGWNTPTNATSDYLNSCNSGLVGVPSNNVGFQYAHSGNGYCGFLALSLGDGNWFEYVQGHFTQPLISGHSYQISFYVSLGDYIQYAVSKIGAYISPTQISRTDTYPFAVIPQIKNPTGDFITDTVNWTLISGVYTALGNEQYITIGNYNDTTLSLDTLQIQYIFSDLHSYYYLDDVSIIDITNTTIANVFSPNNDGINDVFSIPELIEGEKAEIYNRWGILVNEIDKGKTSWDGRTISGELCSDGVYFYIIISKEKTNTQKGFIQLLR